jgi:hypothetical protein
LQQLLAYKIQQMIDNFSGDATFSSPDAKESLASSIMTDLQSFKQYESISI